MFFLDTRFLHKCLGRVRRKEREKEALSYDVLDIRHVVCHLVLHCCRVERCNKSTLVITLLSNLGGHYIRNLLLGFNAAWKIKAPAACAMTVSLVAKANDLNTVWIARARSFSWVALFLTSVSLSSIELGYSILAVTWLRHDSNI